SRQADLLADIMGGGRAEAGDLPIVEDAQIVELLLDRGRHPGKLLEVVGDPTWTGQRFKAQSIGLFPGTSSASGTLAAPISMRKSPWAREIPSIAALAMRSQ